MGKRTKMPEHETNLLLTSGLILLISLILAAMAYFSFTLGILEPPGASQAPSRIGSSNSSGTGVANPSGGTATADTGEDVGDIIFPGFVDFSITNGEDAIELVNSSQNQVAFVFTITDGNQQVLYTSERVQPGAGERWLVTSAFDPGTGTHDVTVKIDSYSLTDDTQYNGVSTTFTVDMG